MTPIVFGVVWALLNPFAVAIGWKLGGKGRRWGNVTCTVGLAMLGLVLLIDHHPEWVIAMGGSRVYLWVAGLWAAWPGIVMLAAAMRMLPRRSTAVLVGVFLAIVVVYFTAASLLLTTFDREKLGGVANDGFCVQTTRWSCGPAACTTMLARMGVEVDEGTMAIRCGTIPHRGTTDYGLWHGLRATLPADRYHVRLVKPTWEEFARLPTPFVTSVELTPWLNHTVCILRVESRTVTIADPNSTEVRRRPTEAFRKTWLNTAVIAEPVERAGSSNGVRQESREGGPRDVPARTRVSDGGEPERAIRGVHGVVQFVVGSARLVYRARRWYNRGVNAAAMMGGCAFGERKGT